MLAPTVHWGVVLAEEPLRILIVEDDEAIGNVLGILLSAEGYRVTCVRSGEAGLERLVPGGYDLVVLDVMLPGLGGLEFCQKVRMASGPVYTPILMISALCRSADKRAGFESGADDYLPKPFDPDELRARVNVWANVCRRMRAAEAAKAQVLRHLMRSLPSDVDRSLAEIIAAAERLCGESTDLSEAKRCGERILRAARELAALPQAVRAMEHIASAGGAGGGVPEVAGSGAPGLR